MLAIGCPGDKPPATDPDDPTPKDKQRDWPSFGSRFSVFITPEPFFNGKLPVIGVVLSGLDVLKEISKVPVSDSRRKAPQVPVVITDCGEL